MLDKYVDRYGSELFTYSSRLISPGFSSTWPGVSDSISSLPNSLYGGIRVRCSLGIY